MSKKISKLYLILFLLLSACGGNNNLRPEVIVDAEAHAKEGLRTFSVADWNSAKRSFTSALLLYQGIDNQQGVLLSHINLAEVALAVDDYSAVNDHLHRADSIVNKVTQENIQLRILLLYSKNALKQKQLNLAKKYLQTLLPEFGDVTLINTVTPLQLVVIANRTKIAFEEERNASLWTERYRNALALSGNNDFNLLARLLRFQAILLQQQGMTDEAELQLMKALEGYKNSLFRPGIAVTLAELGQLYESEQRWQEASDFFKRALHVFRYLNNGKKISLLNKNILEIDLHLRRDK